MTYPMSVGIPWHAGMAGPTDPPEHVSENDDDDYIEALMDDEPPACSTCKGDGVVFDHVIVCWSTCQDCYGSGEDPNG